MTTPARTEPPAGVPAALPAPPFRYWTPGLAAFAAGWLVAYLALAPAPLALAREHGALALLGVAGAVVGNVTAIGGGLVFIPFLVLFYELSATESLALALAVPAFGMTSGAVAWTRRGAMPLRTLAWTAPIAVAAAVGAALAFAPDAATIERLFGPLSIAIGVWVWHMRDRTGVLADVPASARAELAAAVGAGAVLTAWVAIGVGELAAAGLIARHRVRAEPAIALGVGLLAATSIALAALHALVFGDVPWALAGFVLLGAVFGARLAPLLSARLAPRVLKAVFAAVAVGDGILLLLS